VLEADYAELVAGDTNQSLDGFLRDLQSTCPPVEAFCTAKANSAGCVPAISSSGEPTLSTSAFFVSASLVLNGRNGAFVWSLSPASTPFAGGTSCVGAGQVRTPLQDAGGLTSGSDCTGAYAFHFDSSYMNAHALTAGTQVFGQFWSRDPASHSRTTTG
jgi:hypothetical protein